MRRVIGHGTFALEVTFNAFRLAGAPARFFHHIVVTGITPVTFDWEKLRKRHFSELYFPVLVEQSANDDGLWQATVGFNSSHGVATSPEQMMNEFMRSLQAALEEMSFA